MDCRLVSVVAPVCRASAFAGVLLGASSLSAQVLFEQLPLPDTATAPVADSAYFDHRFAESFVIASGEAIGSVVVWGAYLSSLPAAPSFTIDIYGSLAGFPFPLLVSQQAATVDIEPTGIFTSDLVDQLKVTLGLAEPFEPDDGREYFIAITANSANTSEGGWVWNESSAGGTVVFSPNAGGFWRLADGALAFRLEGADATACAADTNNDGMVTPADYNAWILAFNSQSPACDQNGDGECTPADLNAWILGFNTGC